MRRDHAIAVLEFDDLFPGQACLQASLLDLLLQEPDLLLCQAMCQLVHITLTLLHQHGSDGCSQLRFVSLGLNHENAGTLVEVDTDATEVISVEQFQLLIHTPHPRKQIVTAVAVVTTKVEPGIEFFQHVNRKQIVAQQELIGMITSGDATDQRTEIHILGISHICALHDHMRLGDITIRGDHPPIKKRQQ